MANSFEAELQSQIDAYRAASAVPITSWCIALSGGVDSMALLHAMNAINLHEPIRALHIHHGLSSNADGWVAHCQQYCTAHNISFEYEQIKLQSTGKGIEDAARVGRYEVFERSLTSGEVLLQGHHLDDQCETLILRLLRGSGSAGLSGMPASRALGKGALFRPLLVCHRKNIEQYAQDNNFSWVEDESNDSLTYDRNYVRHNVLPVIEKRWPTYAKPLMRVISAAQDEQLLIDDLAELDLQNIGCQQHWSDSFKYIYKNTSSDVNALSVGELIKLSSSRLRNVMRYWLKESQLPSPRAIQWREIEKMLVAQNDAQPEIVWPGVSLKRYSGLLLLNEDERCNTQLSSLHSQTVISAQVCHLPMGSLSLSESLLAFLTNENAVTRCRIEGEYFKPVGRSRKPLKKYLQEMGVPPWVRPYWPVIVIDNQLIWVAGLGAVDSYTQEIAGDAIVWNLD
jgi:tRNA(Ile)-lysidine synthase